MLLWFVKSLGYVHNFLQTRVAFYTDFYKKILFTYNCYTFVQPISLYKKRVKTFDCPSYFQRTPPHIEMSIEENYVICVF